MSKAPPPRFDITTEEGLREFYASKNLPKWEGVDVGIHPSKQERNVKEEMFELAQLGHLVAPIGNEGLVADELVSFSRMELPAEPLLGSVQIGESIDADAFDDEDDDLEITGIGKFIPREDKKDVKMIPKVPKPGAIERAKQRQWKKSQIMKYRKLQSSGMASLLSNASNEMTYLEAIYKSLGQFNKDWIKFRPELQLNFEQLGRGLSFNFTEMFKALNIIAEGSNKYLVQQNREWIQQNFNTIITNVNTFQTTINTTTSAYRAANAEFQKEMQSFIEGKRGEIASFTEQARSLTVNIETSASEMKNSALVISQYHGLLATMHKDFTKRTQKLEATALDITSTKDEIRAAKQALAEVKVDYKSAVTSLTSAIQTMESQREEQKILLVGLTKQMEEQAGAFREVISKVKDVKKASVSAITLEQSQANLVDIFPKLGEVIVGEMQKTMEFNPSEEMASMISNLETTMQTVTRNINESTATISSVSRSFDSTLARMETMSRELSGYANTMNDAMRIITAASSKVPGMGFPGAGPGGPGGGGGGSDIVMVEPIDYKRIHDDIHTEAANIAKHFNKVGAEIASQVKDYTRTSTEAIRADIGGVRLDIGAIRADIASVMAEIAGVSESVAAGRLESSRRFGEVTEVVQAGQVAIIQAILAQLTGMEQRLNANIGRARDLHVREIPEGVRRARAGSVGGGGVGGGGGGRLPDWYPGIYAAPPRFEYFIPHTLDFYNKPGTMDLNRHRNYMSMSQMKGTPNRRHALITNPSREPDPWVKPTYHVNKVRTQRVRKATKTMKRRQRIGHSNRSNYLF